MHGSDGDGYGDGPQPTDVSLGDGSVDGNGFTNGDSGGAGPLTRGDGSVWFHPWSWIGSHEID